MFQSRTDESSKQDGGNEDDDKKTLATLFRRLKNDYIDPLTHVYLQFYVSALPLVTNFNMFLQRSDPQGHNVQPMVKELVKKIAHRIMKPEILKEPIDIRTLLQDEENFLPLNEIYIGVFAKSLLETMLEEGEILEGDQDKVFRAAQAFYKESLNYVIKKLPLNDPFWKAVVWINYFNRYSASWNDVSYFCTRYASVLNLSAAESDILYQQILDYRTLENIDISEAQLEEHKKEFSMDTIWITLLNMKSLLGGESHFGLLFRVACIVLITHHSNGGIEKVYSLVNKNKRVGSERSRLDIDGSLASIIVVKLDRPVSIKKCYEYVPSDELMSKAKSATNAYNTLHTKD